VARLFILLAVLGLVGGIYFFSSAPGTSDPQKAAEQPPEELGYAARNATIVETGDDGRPMYTLVSDLVRQHPNDNRVQLDLPRMTFVASDGNVWHIKSKSGQIRDDGANVELFGDVHLNSLLPGADAPAVIDTSILSFDTKQEVVTTHAPVSINWNGRKLSSTGLTAKLPDHQLSLESRVHGSLSAK
jgi:LPS export ABC transporter protein LptC